jgi:hypothetical protein
MIMNLGGDKIADLCYTVNLVVLLQHDKWHNTVKKNRGVDFFMMKKYEEVCTHEMDSLWTIRV